MLMHIQLFEMGLYSYKKTSEHLNFPDEFEWKGFGTNSQQNETNEKIIYEVVGTIDHMGLSFFGHYISFVKYGDQWYKCNDEVITRVSQKDIHTKNTYMILYRKKQ